MTLQQRSHEVKAERHQRKKESIRAHANFTQTRDDRNQEKKQGSSRLGLVLSILTLMMSTLGTT
jgi:hypothetical protein